MVQSSQLDGSITKMVIQETLDKTQIIGKWSHSLRRALLVSNVQNRVRIAQLELSGVRVPSVSVSVSRVAETPANASGQQRHYESAALVVRDTAGTGPDGRMKCFVTQYLAFPASY